MGTGKERYHFIDLTRGFSILLMIIYHAMYDAQMTFGTKVWFLDIEHPAFLFLQPFFAGVFILISGLSCGFSKSNVGRGVKLLIMSYLLTIVTMFFGEESVIRFGILHFLGYSMVLYGMLEEFFSFWEAQNESLSLGDFVRRVLFILGPAGRPAGIPYLFMFGLYDKSFFSADYFPLLPWIFLFFLGSSLSGAVKERRLPKWAYRLSFPPFEFVGRHSLFFYLLHQPVLYVFFYLAQKIA
jgi:uncharacterized membrane protein